MIGVWMAYAVAVALLLGGAAAALERVFRLRGRPARGVWAAALAGSWVLPALTWLRPPRVEPSVAPTGGGGVADPTLLLRLMEGASTLPASPRPWLEPLGDALLAGWAVLAVGGLALFAVAVRNVARRSRAWPRARVAGEPVRLSPAFGPAVVGVRRPEIVLPRWVLDLGASARHLVLRHEREHRDARDTLLLAAGTVATLAAPWNPGLWWQLRRLRLAVELDCDARVLGAGVSPRSYGDLLLSVGERMGRSVVPVAALAEPPSFLERRLRMITDGRREGATWKAAVGLVTAGVLVGVACETPAPTVADVDDTEAAEAVAEEAGGVIRARAVGVEDASAPLIYVDGVRIRSTGGDGGEEKSLGDLIRPETIDRIEVIKGEAARALFGEEAANGVIQIFTKDGAEGAEATFEIRELPEPGPDAGEARALREVRVTSAAAGGSGTYQLKEIPADEGPDPSGALTEALRVAERGLRNTLGAVTSPIRARQLPSGDGEPAGREVETIRVAPEVPVGTLIVVDGETWSRERLTSLDPDRIDRIEILKGPAARLAYGDRGAAGVVRVFLKR